MFRRVPRVKQHDATDCGAACLASVATHYGLRVPISRIRQYAGTDRSGTNVHGMIEAAGRLGLTAKGVRAPIDALSRVPLPAIAHLLLPGGLPHYVVVYGSRRGRISVMDPRDGSVSKVRQEAFRDLWSGVLILLAPHEDFEPGTATRSRAARFWELLKPHRSVLAQALVGAGLYTLLGLATAVYVQKIIDHVLVNGDAGLLRTMSLAMIVLLLVQAYVGSIKSVLALRTGQKIDSALILGYYRHLLRLPQRFFDTMRTGEIVARLGDAVKIRAFINDTCLDLIVNVFVVVFSFLLMFTYDWRLALVVACVVPCYILVLWVTNAVNRHTLRGLMESAAELESEVVETVGAAPTVKRFDLIARAEGKLEARFVRLLRSVYGATANAIASAHATELLSRLAVVALLWTGSSFVLRGQLTPGELMSFYALLGHLTAPVTQTIRANRTVQDALIAADRLFEILDLEREQTDGLVPLTPELAGDIQFRAVRFRYGSRRLVFDGLELDIEHGRVTALVGESGSGKSTVAAILQKLYEVESGSVRIGQLELRDIDPGSLRRQIAVVPQECHIFASSVVENIVLDDADPDMVRMLGIADRLGIAEFVRNLPNGYHTVLGEHGADLSGGQKQRIAVARALYRRAPILILDEATSHLDSIGEQMVHEVIRTAREDRITSIVIAHRLASIVDSDRIVVLGDGRVLEQGTHHELLRLGGRYTALWRAQTGRTPAPDGAPAGSLVGPSRGVAVI